MGLPAPKSCLVSALGALLALIASQPVLTQAPRTEALIREVRLSDGVYRYGVPLTIGSTEVLAGLDTGAAGLRIMPDALDLKQVKAGTQPEFYNFGSGTRLDGVAARAPLRVGGLSSEASLHLVQKAGCVARQPQCPGNLGLGYGFLGDGLPKEGFRVLLGGNMGRTTIDHPLIAVGARRWIIELPRPGDGAPGRLILNPSDQEVSGFTMLRLVGGFREQDGGGLYDSVYGCLRNEATRGQVCGPVALDTGAFSVRVLNASLPAWAEGAPMTLQLMGDQRTPAVTVHMAAGKLAQSVVYGTAPVRGQVIQPGTAPYYAYAVLYDPVRRMLGFKARPPVLGLPQADGSRSNIDSAGLRDGPLHRQGHAQGRGQLFVPAIDIGAKGNGS